MIFLITRGEYRDYGVEAIIEGPSLTLEQCREAYKEFEKRRNAWIDNKWTHFGPPDWSVPENRQQYNQWDVDHPMQSLGEVCVEVWGSDYTNLSYDEFNVGI